LEEQQRYSGTEMFEKKILKVGRELKNRKEVVNWGVGR